jgi:hypothetical protein
MTKASAISLWVLMAVQTVVGDAAYGMGIWAASGRSPIDHPGSLPAEIPSSDGKVAIKETADGLAVVGKSTTVLQEVLSVPSLTEVLWSPDSRTFVVNVSDGDQAGVWQAFVYSLDPGDRPARRDLRGLLAPFTDRFARCDRPDPVNIGGVAWLDDGKDLLVLAEVPQHATCRNRGELQGFRVGVASWRVKAQIAQGELLTHWMSTFGSRLLPTGASHDGHPNEFPNRAWSPPLQRLNQ